jgi:hypothetical protein
VEKKVFSKWAGLNFFLFKKNSENFPYEQAVKRMPTPVQMQARADIRENK